MAEGGPAVAHQRAAEPHPGHTPKASTLVALDLARRIVRRDLQGGDALPGEPVLMKAYGASRSVIREAMRLLESDGLVVIRRGSGGGSFAQPPDISSTARYAALMLQVAGCTLRDLDRAVLALEPEAVRLIAARRPAEGVALLSTGLCSDADVDTDALQRFHEMIPSATSNRVVQRLFELVSDVRARHSHEALRHSSRPADVQADLSRANAFHRRFLDVVASGDADLAWTQWTRHARVALRALAQDPSETILDLFSARSDLGWSLATPHRAPQVMRLPKGADLIVDQIRRRIVTGSLREGDVLPTELELMGHYGLSRSPVREALRVLEAQRLLATRRGVHAGSVVRAPSMEVAKWHFAMLADYEGVTTNDAVEAYLITLRSAAGFLEGKALAKAAQAYLELGGDRQIGTFLTFADAVMAATGNRSLGFLYQLVRHLLDRSEPDGRARRVRVRQDFFPLLLGRIRLVAADGAGHRGERVAQAWRDVCDALGLWLDAALEGGTPITAFA